MLTAKISNYIRFDKQQPEDYIKDVDKDLINLFTVLKGRVAFGSGSDGAKGENISGEFQVYTSNAVADTEDTIAHTLGAVPIGFIVINIDKGGVVYDGGTAWTSSNIYLKCSTTSTNITLFLLK
jgi:hypothetical protein